MGRLNFIFEKKSFLFTPSVEKSISDLIRISVSANRRFLCSEANGINF